MNDFSEWLQCTFRLSVYNIHLSFPSARIHTSLNNYTKHFLTSRSISHLHNDKAYSYLFSVSRKHWKSINSFNIPPIVSHRWRTFNSLTANVLRNKYYTRAVEEERPFVDINQLLGSQAKSPLHRRLMTPQGKARKTVSNFMEIMMQVSVPALNTYQFSLLSKSLAPSQHRSTRISLCGLCTQLQNF